MGGDLNSRVVVCVCVCGCKNGSVVLTSGHFFLLLFLSAVQNRLSLQSVQNF